MLSALIVLLLASLASCTFRSVLVVVVDNVNVYLPALENRGVTKEFNYGTLNTPIINSISNTDSTWNVYSDSNVGCGPNAAFTNYPFMLDSATLNSDCAHFKSANNLVSDFSSKNSPVFGFYFPDEVNGQSADWLRSFIDVRLFNSNYMSNVITVILSKDKLKHDTASLIMLGTNIAAYVQYNTTIDHPLVDLMEQNGMVLKNRPAFKPASWFEKVFIVVLENQPLAHSLREPNFRKFLQKGTLLTNYMALVNPSQPNYFAMVAGDLMGVHDDSDYDVTGRFIVDLMEEGGVSWKGYMENFPGDCYPGSVTSDKLYRRKHNPFISFDQVRNNKTLCDKIVNSDQLYADLASNSLPQYSFYTPNMNNNGHDTGLEYTGRWMDSFLTPLLTNQSFMDGTLVVLTFDEGIHPDNKIYTILIGDNIPIASRDDTWYSHYSLLRTIEDQYNLPNLGREDATAPVINSTNFYPGITPAPRTFLDIFAPVVGALAIACMLGAVGYFVFVKKGKQSDKYKPLDLEESGSLLNITVKEEDSTEESDDAYLRRR